MRNALGHVLQGFSPGVGSKVLLCSVEGAIFFFQK